MADLIRQRANKIRNERRLDVLFKEREKNDNSLFKLFSAIQCGEAQIEFYDLQQERFVKEIDIKKPFLIGIKMQCWTHGQPEYLHKVFSYNKKLSDLFNSRIKTEHISFEKHTRFYDDHYDRKECFAKRKAFRRNLINDLAETRESKLLLAKFIMLRTRSFKNTYSSEFELTTPFVKDKNDRKRLTGQVTPRFAELEKKLISLGVNVKYLTYFDLIEHHKQNRPGTKLTAKSVKDYINSTFDFNGMLAWNDRELLRQSYEHQVAYIFQNPYYAFALHKKSKDTHKKALKIIAVNKLINTQAFPEEVYSDLRFILPCLKQGMTKQNITNPALTSEKVLLQVFTHLIQNDDYKIAWHLPLDSLKAISQSEEINCLLHYYTVKKATELMAALQSNIEKLDAYAERLKIASDHLVFCLEYFVKHLNNLYLNKELFDKLTAIATYDFSQHPHLTDFYQSGDIESFANILVINNEVEQSFLKVKIGIFNPKIWNRFKLSFRKPFESIAVAHNGYNFNYATKKFKLENIYNVARRDIYSIGFAKLYGKNPNYSVMLSCIEQAIAQMTADNETYLQAEHCEPDSHLKAVMKEAGLDIYEIKHNGLTYENLQTMLKVLRMKVFSEKFPEKGVKAKQLKI